MHPTVFRAFNEICGGHSRSGAVLEVGATLDETTLLNLPALRAASRKVGINKQGGGTFRDFVVVEDDANRMSSFRDGEFDLVLCNAVLEHDPFFWLTIAEMRRVVRVGGLLAIGVPGFTTLPSERRYRPLYRLGRLLGGDGWAIEHSTLTLSVHNYPSDYYRFSPAAFRDVFFAGMGDVSIRTVMTPPRIIGAGVRTAG